MKRAVYAGSFDPVTNGHMWVIKEAADLFDEVIIAVGRNPGKNYTYEENERVMLIEQSCKDAGIENVRVLIVGTMLLADFADLHEANHVVKGIRNSMDLDYEKIQLRANGDLNKNLKTWFLIPPADLEYVSSSFVKSFIGYDNYQNKIGMYVPAVVKGYMVECQTRKEEHSKLFRESAEYYQKRNEEDRKKAFTNLNK